MVALAGNSPAGRTTRPQLEDRGDVMNQTLTRWTDRPAPDHAGETRVSMTVIDALDGFFTLEKRSPTLDGSVPARANPGCAPLLEGNAAGFQLYLSNPGTLHAEGRRLELRLPDVVKAKVFDAYAARLEALVDRGLLERDGFWHRRLQNSPIRHTTDGLALWTGLLVRPARGLWLLLSRAFNRRSLIGVVDEIFADDTAFVPVILHIDRRSLQQQETWLDMELACLTPLKPGVRFTISSIEDSPDVGHALNRFYDEAYLERRFNQGKTTAAYRRLVKDQPKDGAGGSAACRLVVAGGPNLHRLSRFTRYLTGQGIVRTSPSDDDLEFAVVANIFPVRGRWDGRALRDLSGPTASSSRRFRRRWEDLYRVDNEFIQMLAEYVPHYPRKRSEPTFLIASWTFAATPPGWSTILDGYVHGKADGLRGVLSTDSYHWLGPVYQFYEPQAFSIPRGAPAARALPVPRDVLSLPYRLMDHAGNETGLFPAAPVPVVRAR